MKTFALFFLGWFLIINNNIIPEKYPNYERCFKAFKEAQRRHQIVPPVDRHSSIYGVCIPDDKSTPKET